MEKTNRIALFIDLDNFVGFCLDDELPLDLQGEIKKLTEHGRISIRRSFGDIMKLPISDDNKQELRKMLQANLVLHEDIPHYNKYKNTSDIRLAIEALSIAYTHQDIDSFAVIANDRDYMPLFAKLKEIGKIVIGIGSTKESVGGLYKSACDIFYYHSNLCDSNSKSAPKETSDEEIEEIIQLLIETVDFNSSNGRATVGAQIAPDMRARKPDLDFKNYSFLNFRGLCAIAEKRNLINTSPQGSDIKLSVNQTSHKKIKPYNKEEKTIKNEDELKESYANLIKKILNIHTDLPDHEGRKQIFKRTQELLSENPDGVPLKDLSLKVTQGLNLDNSDQPAVFKILYSLYRSDSFIANRTEDNYNPTIISSLISHHEMENNFTKQIITLFSRNKTNLNFNPNVWSIVLKGDTTRAKMIKFYYNYE